MKFRPCIDIHNGQVKQIVGGSLTDTKDQAVENFPMPKRMLPGMRGFMKAISSPAVI